MFQSSTLISYGKSFEIILFCYDLHDVIIVFLILEMYVPRLNKFANFFNM